MAEFLLEIGCEEIPAGWLPGVTKELGQRFAELAAAEHLKPERVETHSTPRRLVLRADVLPRQPDREERIWGPLQTIAMDATGNWQPSALGFAKKQGVRADQLGLAAKPGQELPLPQTPYVYVDKRTPGREARGVLGPIISALLRGLPFPKRMNWDAWLDDDKGAFPFGRPIRWLVALLDGEIVPFEIFELRPAPWPRGPAIITAGDLSYGHRFFPRGKPGKAIRVRGFEDLRDKLREHGVLLLREQRVTSIDNELQQGLSALQREIKGGAYLKGQWADLVEYPAIVFGEIPDEFQNLPLEVVATVLVHHQKYIPTGSAAAGISGFVAVTDTDGACASSIVRGMQRVVVARLRDAVFFFREDQKHWDRKKDATDPLSDLDGVVFHRKLGTYKEKTRRIKTLVYALGSRRPSLLTDSERQAADAAAEYCKADLTTLMVREFPELQGTMGAIYMRAAAMRESPAQDAVRWHYHPISIEEGALPAGQLAGDAAKAFAAVSLADKVDTLVGYFGIEETPTGSRDPFGLRRAAQGVVRVLLDFWRTDRTEARPDLTRLIRDAISGYDPLFNERSEAIVDSLQTFLHERLAFILAARGFAADEIAAGIDPNPRSPHPIVGTTVERERAHPVSDPYACYLRVRAVHKVRAETPDDFDHLAVAFKRARNILKDSGPPASEVDVACLKEPAEHELYSAVQRLRQTEAGWNADLEGRLRELAGLRAPVDRFFDDVLVMAEDPKLRANRLGLLSSALSLFYRIADISKLGG